MNYLYSTVNSLRDKYTPASHTSTFRKTGEITPEEFVAAGDYLVYKFPSWSWADADPISKRAGHLPPGKQFLVTRHVPCHRRVNDDFAGDAGREEAVVEGSGKGGGGGGDEDGWLRTGDIESPQQSRMKDVRTVDECGNVGERDDDDDDDDEDDNDDDDGIPDMEDEDDDEAIIHDAGKTGEASGRRTYTLYIMYSPYYRTPRLFMSGYLTNGHPLPPRLMMDDVMGDYKDKTVTLEDFPFFSHAIQMASIHPCKHAHVMRAMLERADAALALRREKLRAGVAVGSNRGMEGLLDDIKKLNVSAASSDAAGAGNDEWEEVEADVADQDMAIRVDQYLVVFLKFIASVTPSIEYDYTMGV